MPTENVNTLENQNASQPIEGPFLQDFFNKPETYEKVQTFLDTNENIQKIGKDKVINDLTKYLKENSKAKLLLNIQLNKNVQDQKIVNDIINKFVSENIIKDTQVFSSSIENNNQSDNQSLNINIDIIKEKQESVIKKIETNKTRVETDETRVETDKIKIETKDNLKEMFNIVEQERQSIIQKNPQLDIKPDSNEYKQQQAKLEQNGTLKILTDKGLGAEQIAQFILFNATSDLAKSDPKTEKECEGFLVSFKRLENELDIPDSTRETFSEKNISSTRKELFSDTYGNENLIKTSNDQKKEHARDYDQLFEKKDGTSEDQIKSLGDTYGKFLDTEEQKNLAILTKKDPKQYTEDEQKNRSELVTKLESIEKTFQDETSTTLEQMNIIGPIMGLANYMDMDIGNDFSFNKSRDIAIQNNILSIKGDINNMPFTLFSDLSQPSKLETSDYLNTTVNSSIISLGTSEQTNKQKTPFVLPGKQNIRNTSKDIFTANHENILKDSSSIQEYTEKLQNKLTDGIKDLYGYKDLVKVRIEKQIQKDLAAQESVKLMNSVLDPDGKDFFDGQKSFSKETSNPQVFDFLKKLDYSLEDYSLEEMSSFRSSIGEFQSTINRIKNHEKDDSPNKIRSYLNKLFGEQGRENSQNIVENKSTTQDDKLNISEFFTLFTEKKNSKDYINPEYLSKFVNEVQKSEPDIAKLGEATYNQIVKKDEINETEKMLEAYYE